MGRGRARNLLSSMTTAYSTPVHYGTNAAGWKVGDSSPVAANQWLTERIVLGSSLSSYRTSMFQICMW